MAEVEILGPDEKTELIEGRIIRKIRPMTPALATGICKSCDASPSAFSDGYMVAVQYPLALSEFTELEPAVLAAVGRYDDFGGAHPGPSNAALIVEFADHSSAYDREWKARLYAASGIMDHWFVDLVHRYLEMRRQPQDGEYLSLDVYDKTEAVAPLAAPDSPVRVADLLPLRRSVNREALPPG